MANYSLSNMPSSFNDGDTVTVSYTGGAQSFTFEVGGVYKIECYGGQGGSTTAMGEEHNIGGYGGYVTGTYTPTSNTQLYLFVGGKGQDSPYNDQDYGSVVGGAGGYNGGGAGGGGWGAGGGGCSAVSSNSTMSNTTCMLIAGGGGGCCDTSYLSSSANARTSGTTSNITSTYVGASGSYGKTGSYYYDTHGGGGGYYGGASVSADDAVYAYGGVNYIGSGLTSTSQKAGSSANHTGDGKIIITVVTAPRGLKKLFVKTTTTTWKQFI